MENNSLVGEGVSLPFFGGRSVGRCIKNQGLILRGESAANDRRPTIFQTNTHSHEEVFYILF